MTIEQREIVVSPILPVLRVPMERWHAVKQGDVLYEAPDLKLQFTNKEASISRVEVGGDDSLRVTLFIVDVFRDAAEHQRVNYGHEETIIYDKEKLKTLVPEKWFRNNKFLRGFQLRVR